MFEIFELKHNNSVFTIEVSLHGKTIQQEHNLEAEISIGLYINHGNSGDVIAGSYFNMLDLFKDIQDGVFDSIADSFIEEEHLLMESYGETCFCTDSSWTSLPENMYIPNKYITEQLKIINKTM